MANLTLYKENCVDFTVVSNLFIDKYMEDANDAQLKVYLYLIRMLNAGKATSISDIADKFNHTEKDVMRSLRYWEKQGILALDFDQAKNLVGIHFTDLSSLEKENAPAEKELPASAVVLSAPPVYPFQPEIANVTITPSPFTKPVFTAQQIKEFNCRETTRELFEISQKYLGRTLSGPEMQSILFFSETLHFSNDLIYTLLEYCIDRGKKDFKYIEKVAIGWAEEGISTPEEAQNSSGKYSKNVYVIMNELGKNGVPTSKEMEFINRWTKDFAFSLEIILNACQRTVLATDRHRFEYCDSILTSWKNEGVSEKSDIEKRDELHQKKKSAPKPSKPAATGGKFNQFDQNEYDFDALTKKLISN